ncbi:MAG TPA: glycosyltransferase family 2 protein [Steroidobacteraceae bacterium]|jgi:glycosyltransferase involved in cell wall biosynthesis|nr:glycosyltransferase family 2 protein [Steroidobacteraceae bacterium]
MQPAVSIILPTFNRLSYLRDAVDSVFSQTFHDWELIIADDGSNEKTKAYLRTFTDIPRVKLLWLPHSGNPPAVRNAALREANGEYIAFLDSDDVWMPDKLAAQIASLRTQASRRWSYTGCIMVDGHLNPLVVQPRGPRATIDGWIHDALLKAEIVVVQSSVVVSRNLLAAAGGYPEDLPICGDYELYAQLARRSPIDFVDAPLVQVRRHKQHYSDDLDALRDLRRFLEKVQRSGAANHLESVLERRRATVSAGIARGYAQSGNRRLVLSTLVSSAYYSWPYRAWWYGAMAATVQAFAPVSIWAAIRRHLRLGRNLR